VLDDWEKGYSIYRLQGASLPEDDFHCTPSPDAPPAESPLVRIEAQHSLPLHGPRHQDLRDVTVLDTETLGASMFSYLQP
jgi:hypothetical protein